MRRALVAVLLAGLCVAGISDAAAPPPFSETVTVSANVATRTMPSASTEGMAAGGMRGFRASVCATSGQTLSGTGTINVFSYDPDAALWMPIPDLTYQASQLAATQCQGSACRCLQIRDFNLTFVQPNGWRFLIAPSSLGVSGGANVVVRIHACPLNGGC